MQMHHPPRHQSHESDNRRLGSMYMAMPLADSEQQDAIYQPQLLWSPWPALDDLRLPSQVQLSNLQKDVLPLPGMHDTVSPHRNSLSNSTHVPVESNNPGISGSEHASLMGASALELGLQEPLSSANMARENTIEQTHRRNSLYQNHLLGISSGVGSVSAIGYFSNVPQTPLQPDIALLSCSSQQNADNFLFSDHLKSNASAGTMSTMSELPDDSVTQRPSARTTGRGKAAEKDSHSFEHRQLRRRQSWKRYNASKKGKNRSSKYYVKIRDSKGPNYSENNSEISAEP